MINIIIISPKSELFGNVKIDYPNRIYEGKPELDFLLEKDLSNEPIYVVPHKYSFLKENFIKPHLDENGIMDKECFGKIFNTNIGSMNRQHEFDYIITESDEIQIECDGDKQNVEKFEQEYKRFINRILGL